MTNTVNRLAVIGAGTMGHGIAYTAALSGFDVTIYDGDGLALASVRERAEAILAKGRARGKLTDADEARVRANLSVSDELAAAVQDADLVIEAIVENLEVKRQVLGAVEESVSEQTIIASNTSSLPISQLAKALSVPSRVVGMHFFNPVHIMRLLEVVVHDGTGDTVRDTAVIVGQRMGKEPIVVKDSPGFASSRLGIVFGLEAMRMLEQGVAGAEDIDKAMELGYAHPMGPLRLSDLVGLDVRLAIADTLAREIGGAQYEAPKILRRLVAEGHIGKKAGRGFYTWDE